MSITISSNSYAGNISETKINFVFSAEKERLKLINTGDTILEIVVGDEIKEIVPEGKFEYNGYISGFSLKSTKGMGTYSVESVDSLRADTANLESSQNKLLKINSVADLGTAFATFNAAKESGTINITMFTDSIWTLNSANGISLSTHVVDVFKEAMYRKYPTKTLNFNYLSIAGESIQSWNANKTFNSTEKTWIEHVKDSSPDLLIIAFGMNNTSFAAAKQFKYNFKGILDYINTNFTKKPSIAVCTTPIPAKQGNWATFEAQNSRDIAAYTARYYGLEKGCYILDVNRVFHIKRDGYDCMKPILKMIDTTILESSITGTYNGDLTELTMQNINTRLDINIPLRNFRLEMQVKFKDFPAGSEHLNFSLNNTTENVMPNTVLLLPNTSSKGTVRCYGNSPDSAELGSTATAEYISAATYSDDTYRPFVIEKINNVVKIVSSNTVVIRDINYNINNAPAKISIKKDVGSVGVAYIKDIKLYDYEYESYIPSLTDEQIYGLFNAADPSTTKLPYGGNGVNHPSSIGISEIYSPCINEFVNDLPLTNTKNITKNIASGHADIVLTQAECVANTISITGTPDAGFNVVLDGSNKQYLINNGTAQIATIKNAAGTTATVAAGKQAIVWNNGTNVIAIASN